MDFLDWIAASKRMEFVTRLGDEKLRAYFARFKPRGFLTDFIDQPIVADGSGKKLTISRKSSFFGRSQSVRCVVELERVEHGSLLRVRLWHGPFFTTWLCLSYTMAFVFLFAAWSAVVQGDVVGGGIAMAITGSVMASFWIFATGVFNALLRMQQKSAIDELVAVFSEMEKIERRSIE